ncbi:MAG: ribonuclease Y [Gemmataceae bacterium]|nr:ribonuclease Y [Gemmataceae bacterium]MDW8264437.1 ribonuclease Y [Gemmataceae bacterium]
METLTCVILLCVAALVAFLAGYGGARLQDHWRRTSAQSQVAELLSQARKEADNLIKEAELRAKDEQFQKREEFNREMEQARAELREQERRLEKREDNLEQKHQLQLKKERALEHTQKKLKERQEWLEKRHQELEALVQRQTQKLYEISGLSRDEAEKLLFKRLEQELSDEVAARIQRHEEAIRSASEVKAREILASAIQRYAAEHTADTTVSTVDIPSDDMKGRIIGREGRNIRTFEKCTGVDVIVDDTPGVVIVSAFDNIRREVARLALTKLIQDGRIHPSRIEEVVKETQEEMERHILELGRQAVLEANIGPVHEKLQQLLGRLRFRTSYSQNVLQHSLEVAHLCGMMADELGLNGSLARRCGLLHDIGKAADHEMEGGHPKIGAELAKRYGETNRDVLHAIAGHHDDVTVGHIYTVLVAAADAISAARPGARRETLEKYIKRLEELETVASSFPGVEHAYAIQAGREVRVIANAAQTTDSDAVRVCRDIARAIEQRLSYPGEIKVTVVRETRAVEYAR